MFIVCLLSSCGSTIKLQTIDESYSTDTIIVDAKIPQLSGLGSKDLQEKINTEYQSLTTDLLNNFLKSAKKTNEQSTFTIETIQHYNKNNFLSIVSQINCCVNKSQKNSFRITKNIDTQKCIELSLSDMFCDDTYIDTINEQIEKEVSSNPDKYSTLWEKPKISQNQRFYINDKYLVLFYPPYELSYYERGFVEIPISLENMSGYLKPEYRCLISK